MGKHGTNTLKNYVIVSPLAPRQFHLSSIVNIENPMCQEKFKGPC